MNIGIILTEKNSFFVVKKCKNKFDCLVLSDFNCMFFLSMLILTANYFGLFIYQPLLTLFELKKGVMMTPKRRLFFSALFQIVFQLNITSRFQGRCIVKRAVVLHTNFGRLCLLLFLILARF